MPTAWVYVDNNGSGVPNIRRSSHAGTTVTQTQPGAYVVTFPLSIYGLAAVATLANSVGTITAIPGESTGLSPNQVRVFTLTLQNQFNGAYDFGLAVFYQSRLWPWWWVGVPRGQTGAVNRLQSMPVEGAGLQSAP